MIYSYPRNPYRYAKAGYVTINVPQRMTWGQKRLCGLAWIAAVIVMAIIYIQKFSISF